ncbi:MAG: hypothetical protein ACYC7E_02945 [Armatimonadota bacterium]
MSSRMIGAWSFVLFAVVLASVTSQAASLRGFGEVNGTVLPLPGGLAGMQFQCNSPEHATILLHKLGRDLAQSATASVSWQTVNVAGKSVPILVRPCLGSFLLAASDRMVFAITSTQTEKLEAVFGGAASQLAGARFFDAQYRYPKYLDKFSHFGIGSWYPYGWGDELSKDKPNTVDDHFMYAKGLDLTIQPNSGGYQLRNLLPKFREYDRPYHFAQWHEWSQSLARLAPEELVLPGTKFSTAPGYYGQIGYGSDRLLAYRDWTFQQTVKELVDDPNLVDWLEPHGEIGPFGDYYYWDFSERSRRHFIRWLQEHRRYTLATLGQAWHGNPKQFRAWEQVPIPMNYDFYGWQPDSIQADSSWRVHTASLDDGLKRGYQEDRFNDAAWPGFRIPGGELLGMFWRAAKPTWYRGTVTVTTPWLAERKARGRIYLNAITMAISRGWKNPDRLWINGLEMASLFNAPGYPITGQVDVTNLLRPGANTLVYLPANTGQGMAGIFFLATKPLGTYPFSDTRLNARFIDWQEFISWCWADRVEKSCQAIRGVDPDRPIKIHAAYDKDLLIRLQEKYGGYGHNTGEGSFLRAWDKRLGYPRKVGASAEFGGSINDPTALRRWIGFFTFEGLDAFDNFHNIQSMMYSPAKDLWVEYMPYIKLANRREIKQPDIALLWSSANNKLLPRNIPYIFDLGRGDLQSIGYSYAYLDELGLEDGLAKDYPVLWDCGTWIMSPRTVERIKAYVEAGGTFVALQETGRHTFTQRDAWPISDLTGFKVRGIRPMEGAVSILKDQPLFTKLAGKSFYNRGKSIDYSDVNFADKCLTLEAAAPGTQAIARYEDGAVAVGLRKLGKGRVIVLGSPFWRDSYDKAGLWWPGEGQCAFLEELFANLGLAPLATANSHAVWREHYLANNGTEEYLTLWNPTDTRQTLTLDWKTCRPATTLIDPKDGKVISGTVNGMTVHLENVALEPYETRIVATQAVRPPVDAVNDWYAHLAAWWKVSAPGKIIERPDLPLYEVEVRKGTTTRVVTAAEYAQTDLASLSKQTTLGEGWKALSGFARPSYMGWKLDNTQRIIYRCPLALPATWKAGDTYQLVFQHYWREYLFVKAAVNGTVVLDVSKPGTKEIAVDVSSLLALGGNNLLVFSTPSTGFIGDIKLVRKPRQDATLEVTGNWQVQTSEDSGLSQASLPGKFTGLFAVKRDVVIPASWQGSRVFIDIEPENPADYNSFAINDKMVLSPVAWYPAVTYMDITPWVKFGQPNTLTLLPFSAARSWTPGVLGIKRITLQRVNKR